jgi:cobalamin biosynthesis Mg chelatase CobN
VLALLAVAALPALAQAEDSSGIQYETEHFESGVKPKKKATPEGQSEAPAKVSKAPTQQASPQPSGGGAEEAEEANAGAAPNGGGGSGGGGSSPSGKAGSPSGGGNEASVSSEKPVAGTQTGQPVSHSSGGGSSPLVPILIAVAVLAAISIGAVIYRQRRQGSGGSGSPVSPNAG